MRRNSSKLKPQVMKPKWDTRYEFSLTKCSHKLHKSYCLTERVSGICHYGVRNRKIHLLSGNAMAIWQTVEYAMSYQKQRLKLMRTSGLENDSLKVIGLAIPHNAINRVLDSLRKMAELQTVGVQVYNGFQLTETYDKQVTNAGPSRATTTTTTAKAEAVISQVKVNPVKPEVKAEVVKTEVVKTEVVKKEVVKSEVKSEIKTEMVKTESGFRETIVIDDSDEE